MKKQSRLGDRLARLEELMEFTVTAGRLVRSQAALFYRSADLAYFGGTVSLEERMGKPDKLGRFMSTMRKLGQRMPVNATAHSNGQNPTQGAAQ